MLEAFLHPLHFSWYLTDRDRVSNSQRMMVKIREISLNKARRMWEHPGNGGRVMQCKHLERTWWVCAILLFLSLTHKNARSSVLNKVRSISQSDSAAFTAKSLS